MAEFGLGHRMWGSAQRVAGTHSCVLGPLGLGCSVGSHHYRRYLPGGHGTVGICHEVHPLNRKNTLIISPFCSMCPIQSTVVDVPIASNSIPVTVALDCPYVTKQGSPQDCRYAIAREKVSCRFIA